VKKALIILMTILLMVSAALAEGMIPLSVPITIDGVRTAFFDSNGAYLQPMEMNGLLYVPAVSLGENLGIDVTADAATLAVTVNGVRAAFFSEDNVYLPPVAVDGVVYVPLTAFAQTAAVTLVREGNSYGLFKNGFVAESVPTQAPQPLYGYVPLTAANFLDFFTVETGSSRQDINYKRSSFTVTSNLTCQAATSYGLENVSFTISHFGTVKVPASGYVTKSIKDTIQRYEYSSNEKYVLGQSNLATQVLLRSYTLEKASGKLRMSYEEAEALKKEYYEKAKGYFELGAYDNAIKWYELLVQEDYLDSKELLKEARARKAAAEKAKAEAAAKKKEEEKQEKYNAAQASFDNGDWDTAITGFKALGDYKDSKAKVTAATENKNNEAYEKALALEKDGQYEEAIAAFEALKDYKDSAQRLTACSDAKALKENRAAYEAAEKLEASGDYVGAYHAFAALGDFENSAERASELLKIKTENDALALLADNKIKQAIALLETAGTETKTKILNRFLLRHGGCIDQR